MTAGAGGSWRRSETIASGRDCPIKMLKRQMFGRAGFDLLRKRVLLA